MPVYSRRAAVALLLMAAGCGAPTPSRKRPQHGGSAEVNRLITKYAHAYDVPEDLVHRVVQRESGYNPAARNGPYYGLMQIQPETARTMGHRGSPSSLLDADTNLKYAVKYLRGAWLCADGNEKEAVGWYARGYYYEAKRRGILKDAGLRG